MLRTAEVTITREGRDQGGVFVLTEKPAMQASEWFIRAMMLLARSGADVPPNIMQLGPAGFLTLGIGTVLTGLGKAPWFEVKPLLDELLQCVTSYQPPSAIAPVTNRHQMFAQIEEPATILQLHEEVVSLHLGFSLVARLSTYRSLVATMLTDLGETTSTSTEDAPPLSAADLPA